ncbi:hypothetical protein FA95DRAFT_1607874 [Auriscalpium vulgare]|uniref:Uncharacterized protein n=1 Tax=Auriscalpium vulgare TaxID=40419 RepID=A0ACB8RNQ9_9AGAM|nr:hypothetical protein FA95DRAFT_1607874 [Auriscalpium vulgare]
MSSPTGQLPSPSPKAISNPIFDKAVQGHIHHLEAWELADFAVSTPEGVRSVAAKYHSTHTKSRLLRCVQRLSRVIAPLEKFFSAVDNGVSSHPEVAGIVWGALRFVMQSIHSLSAYFEKIGDVLDDIVEALPHYQDYADTLFAKSQRVMEGLAGVYGDILLTCTTIRRIYKNAQDIRGSIFVSLRALNPWDHAFDDVHEACRGVLSKHLDAGRWLLNRPEFENWADSPGSGMLWLRGKAGAGKTVLSSIVVNSLSAQLVERKTVAYFYCQFDDPQKRSDPRIVIGTLLHQVISQLPTNELALRSSNAALQDLDTLRDALSSIAKQAKNVFLIVDALDEFDDSSRWKLIQALKHLSQDAKVFVASRDLLPSQYQDDTLALLRDVPAIPADPEHVKGDIIDFVERNVRFIEEDGLNSPDNPEPPLKVASLPLRDEIRKVLLERADGMFLYVRLQILHLRRQGTEHELRVALQSLPSGISATFIRALQDIEALPPQRRERVRRLFRWLACSPRPFTVADTMVAVVIDDMDDAWDESRRITRFSSLLADCGNLINTRLRYSSRPTRIVHVFRYQLLSSEEKQWVQFVHASVKEFLVSRPSSPEEAPLSAYHYYPLSEARLPLIHTGFKYRHVVDPGPSIPGYFLMHDAWESQLRLAGEDGQRVLSDLCQFLDPGSSTREKWRAWAIEQYQHLEQPDYHDLYFGHWGTHASPAYYDLPFHHIAIILHLPHILPKLVKHSHPNDSEPTADLEDINKPNSYGHTALHIACAVFQDCYGDRILRFLLEEGADVAAADDRGRTALHVAAQNHRSIIPLMVLRDYKLDLHATDNNGQTALHVATSIPLKVLLDHGSDINATDNNGQTALHVAVLRPDQRFRKITKLLRRGADVEARDHSGRTPLLTLCFGHSVYGSGCARRLFKYGASASVVDAAGKTALHLLAESSCWWGLISVLDVLLAHGADPQVVDSSGRRAADYAQYAELYLFLQGAAGEEPDMDKLQKLPLAKHIDELPTLQAIPRRSPRRLNRNIQGSAPSILRDTDEHSEARINSLSPAPHCNDYWLLGRSVAASRMSTAGPAHTNSFKRIPESYASGAGRGDSSAQNLSSSL